jgi:hypothetical protein
MRTRNDLQRLEAAGKPLLVEAESVVDAAEEERILERILASDRAAVAATARPRPTRRVALVLGGAVVLVAAAVFASLEFGGHRTAVPPPPAHHHLPLTGPEIQLAGYRFRTPAGFKGTSLSCPGASSGSGPQTVVNGFKAAASADGGCVEAFFLIRGNPDAPNPTLTDAQPVAVGSYQGYFVSQGSAGDTLYVELPAGPAPHPYLVLYSQGLTEDQLIAVAQSGLPSNP